MSVHENGIMFLEGTKQDGIPIKKRMTFKDIYYDGELNISSTKTQFKGKKGDITFETSDILNIELNWKKIFTARTKIKRVLFNLKNGDVYSFSCDAKGTIGLVSEENIEISLYTFQRAMTSEALKALETSMNKKTEAFFMLLDKLISTNFNGDNLNEEISKYEIEKSNINTEARSQQRYGPIFGPKPENELMKTFILFGVFGVISVILVIVVLIVVLGSNIDLAHLFG